VGQKEVDEAKARKAADATWDAAGAKLKSCVFRLCSRDITSTGADWDTRH
jgi:hypothetical protein